MSNHAFITGAAKRVGRHIALHLATKGYAISLHYRHSKQAALETAEEIRALGVNCHLICADLSAPVSAQAAVADAINAQGAISLMVHNASLFEKDNVRTLNAASLAEHMTVNMMSPVLMSSALLGNQPADTPSHIICLTDGMHNWSISPEFLSYSMSKLALEQFVEFSAISFAPNIRLNAIALGATLPGHMDKPDTFDKIRRLSPLQRTGNPDDVCRTIDLLEATPSITGQIISLSSGMQLRRPHATASAS